MRCPSSAVIVLSVGGALLPGMSWSGTGGVSGESGAGTACGGSLPCECGDTLVADITLTADLVACPSDGIVIGADNVVLDCAGHSICGIDDFAAIRISGHENFRLKNCTLCDSKWGILADTTDGLTVRSSSFLRNGITAIWVRDSRDVLIEGNYFERNGYLRGPTRMGGVATFSRVDHSVIRDNEAEQNGSFTEPRAGSGDARGGDTVDPYAFRSNYVGGITLEWSTHNTIEGNRLNRTGEDNIWLRSGSHSNKIIGNHLSHSSLDGIWIRESDHNVVQGNTVSDCRFYGIYLRSAVGTTIRDNVVINAGIEKFSGIGMGGYGYRSTDNTLIDNEVYQSREGLRIHERATDNAVHGLLLDENRTGVILEGWDTACTNYIGDADFRRTEGTDVLMKRFGQTLEFARSVYAGGISVAFDTLAQECEITASWLLDLVVRDRDGAPVSGAYVMLRDVNGTTVHTASTGEDGRIDAVEVTGFTQTESARTDLSPHTLVVLKPGFHPLVERVVVDRNRSLAVTLRRPAAGQEQGGPGKTGKPLALDLRCAPNPFRGETELRFTLPERSDVRLEVFAPNGRRAATVAAGGRTGGNHAVTWRGFDDAGSPLSPGAYFVRLETASGSKVSKIVILGR